MVAAWMVGLIIAMKFGMKADRREYLWVVLIAAMATDDCANDRIVDKKVEHLSEHWTV